MPRIVVGGKGTINTNHTHGFWSESEKLLHINVLELKAVLFSVISLLTSLKDSHVMIMCDNMTAVHTINNMGTCRSLDCHSVVLEIWNWATKNNNWVTATHIPGTENTEADTLSRITDVSHEWKLNNTIFLDIITHFSCKPDIDLFASRINKQTIHFTRKCA